MGNRFKYYNANPISRKGEDCTVRAISKVMGKSWDEVYFDLCIYGYLNHDMPTANHVWGKYLKDNGYIRTALPNTCPDCYTVDDFAKDHPKGRYILALNNHIVAVCDGSYYDTWDSGNEVPFYYWKEGKDVRI